MPIYKNCHGCNIYMWTNANKKGFPFSNIIPALLVILLLGMGASFQLSAAQGQPEGKRGNEKISFQKIYKEMGTPFHRDYLPTEYNGAAQVWAINQDSRGFIYAGCSEGDLLQYDGSTWRRIPLPNLRSVVRSLYIDKNDTIYVGSKKELGYLEPDENGQLRYVSLMDKIPADERDFLDVWNTFGYDGGVFYFTYAKQFLWKDGKFKIWSHYCNGSPDVLDGKLYITDRSGRFLRLENDKFKPVVKRAEYIRGILAVLPLPAPNKDVLVIPWDGILKPLNLETGEYTDSFQVPEETNRFLKQHTFYSYTRFPDGRHFIATLSGGCVLLDPYYNILKIFNKNSGLHHEVIFCSHLDHGGSMWVGTGKGIIRLELDAPLSFFNENYGLKGAPLSACRHNGVLYAATFTGVYYLENQKFKRVRGINSSTRDLIVLDEKRLIAAGINGLYIIENNDAYRIQDLVQVFCITRSRRNPNMFYVGLKQGLKIVIHQPGNRTEQEKWILKDPWQKRGVEIDKILEDDDGGVWLDILDSGAAKIRVSKGGHISTIKWYNTFPGLDSNNKIGIGRFRKYIVAYSSKGFYRYDSRSDSFKPAPDLNKLFHCQSADIIYYTPDNLGNFWLIKQKERKRWISFVQRETGEGNTGLRVIETPFRRIPGGGQDKVFPEPDGTAWFDSSLGLIRYTPFLKKNYQRPFNALVSEVRTVKSRRVIFGGAYYKVENGKRMVIDRQPREFRPELPYKDNSIQVWFGAPSFDRTGANQYSFYLEGMEKTWSRWTAGSRKEYSNLWEGSYTFHVKARNIYGVESESTSFSFSVAPPWYRTVWAYIFYGVIFFFVFYMGVRIYSYRLKRANIALEEQVEKRTREISRQKEAIEEQARELLAANEAARRERETADSANRSKSQFLARMSHEIRTPLNSVIGFAEILRDTSLNEEQYEYVNTIQRSGDALISVINDILDFSRIEAGELALDVIDFDPEMTAYDVCEMVMPRLTGKPVELMCRIGDHVPAFVSGDAIRFRQVLLNLLGNASKFTESGEIEVSLEVEEEKEDDDSPGANVKLHVTVRDTGIGIPPGKLVSVFDAFRQADGSISRKYGGTGLGLPISREIARLMGGDVWADSQPGDGSRFHFTTWMKRSGKKAKACYKEGALTGKRAIAVDDNPRHLEILTHALECPGLEVTGFTGIPGVISCLRESLKKGEPIDICIIDINLGEDSGIDLAREIRALEPPLNETPLLAFSSSMRRRSAACKEAGFHGYLPKPIRRRRLLQMIDRLLKIKSGEAVADTTELVTQHTIRESAKHSVHILLAEDNAINRKLAVHMLTRGGYRVTAVPGGEEAVAAVIAEPGRFDLVFMDVRMPGIDGREATQRIRAAGYHDLPIIAVTADSFREDRQKCLDAGMNDYISKPIKREITFKMIKKWTRAFQPD